MTNEQFKRIDQRLEQLARLLELMVAGNEILNKPRHVKQTLSALDEIGAVVKPMADANKPRT